MLKGDLRKQAILDTAETLFFEKGYVKATIQDFLDALDCSKGSFYHHFESKLQVLTALCRQKTAKSFEAYREKQYDATLDQLNALIYYAMPFREGEEKTVAMLLPLVAADYEEGMGDVAVSGNFATPYTQGEKVAVLIGIVENNQVAWTVYEGIGQADGSVKFVVDAATALKIQNGTALVAVCSK